MPEKRKDNKGRNLRTGEYYDEKNKRYMFRKMGRGLQLPLLIWQICEGRKTNCYVGLIKAVSQRAEALKFS